MKIKVTFREHQLEVFIAGVDNEETGEWLAGQVVAQLQLPCSGRDIVLVVRSWIAHDVPAFAPCQAPRLMVVSRS